MEEQWRSKEIYYENRQKEMHKHIKAHEATIAKYEKERSIVDTRLLLHVTLQIFHHTFYPELFV